ncbi:hypothetical protein F4780DRAFT_755101 [Xylariomycetidae sp. FL0641]|nr:hypothetical protein F4780DRAFT_755101 [Xylariomycetidae sp. FL0641]
MKDDSARAYRSIRAEDHDDNDDSSFGEAETIVLSEKDYRQSPPPSMTRQFLSGLLEYRFLVDTFLLVVIVALLFERHWAHRSNNHFYEGAGDMTGFAPQFAQQITTFSPDPSFVPENGSEFFSKEVREKWLGLVPKGLGYLEIKDPEEYDNLPTKLDRPKDKEDDKFVVTSSMTHQLHCLHSIAEAYSAYSSGEKKPKEEPWHVAHCFDYLRQSIMCCGDVALEGQATTFPDGFTGSDGWDAKHVCKDYDQVLEYLEQNRANDAVWI